VIRLNLWSTRAHRAARMRTQILVLFEIRIRDVAKWLLLRKRSTGKGFELNRHIREFDCIAPARCPNMFRWMPLLRHTQT
jgi:hypothetical protein